MLLYVPFVFMRVSNLFQEMSTGFGLPQIWSPGLRVFVAIVCIACLILPWVFDHFINKEIEKKPPTKPYNFKEAILIVGLAFTTIPALSGFFLKQLGGPLNEAIWFSWTSVVGGAVWSLYFLVTYLKKPANQSLKRTG
jgi:hypothetical protein